MKELTIGITGASGFIATHLIRRLKSNERLRVVACPRDVWDDADALRTFVDTCDVIVHLAGANRGEDRQLYEINVGLARRLAEALGSRARPPHVLFASSVGREWDNAYGRSKREAERCLVQWAENARAPLSVLVIPNVFGPGCRPFYNSVVATFCHQLAHGERPTVLEDRELELIYVNELVERIDEKIHKRPEGVEVVQVAGTGRLSVSALLHKLEAFRASYFDANVVPDLSEPFDAHLYTTFLSHVDLDDHRHRPVVHQDDRGRLLEIIRLAGGGQIFFSTTKPGVIRGNHFHTRKIEWFCVLRGEAAIRIRPVGGDAVREFRVSGDVPEFISIPPIHTHQIENVGHEDLLTMFWCNEIFQPADPDTFYEKVA